MSDVSNKSLEKDIKDLRKVLVTLDPETAELFGRYIEEMCIKYKSEAARQIIAKYLREYYSKK